MKKIITQVLGAGLGFLFIYAPALQGKGQDPDKTSSVTQYHLDPQQSTVHFVSVKDKNVKVPGLFKIISGKIRMIPLDNNMVEVNHASISIDIDSVETRLEERDQNIRRYFFETDKNHSYKKANFVLNEPLRINLKKTKHKALLKGTLNLHGRKGPLSIPISIVQGKEGWRIKNQQPVKIEFEKWSFFKSVNKLMKMCGHKELESSADINFDLLFIP
ncbi:MAG: hypothetical protein A3I75_04195 [Deltaproteobacteria bacterium RIFCSPLOWO2_02_FULL_50_16]|nr:MAG: hypothetical protein A2053_03005 [Deltaproteobacteria bacterium GWA2_50_8]OGQ25971.1 MAG: hypothetical protein A3B79_07875 [Deltaproteobacteria bacterium RIFCSPHIGHO2_02_FULL_50_15]OGQ57855.1 MAG: hypothetical protein A3I75_04195 [Deltaproteobacteria bacterium RIFCSPLOWO2_02_FULL_50_16]